jgi:hypothetical protein
MLSKRTLYLLLTLLLLFVIYWTGTAVWKSVATVCGVMLVVGYVVGLLRRRKGVGSGVIRFDQTEMRVTVTYEDGSTWQKTLRWQEVNAVVAYKRDLFTVDEICLAFSSPAGRLEISEQMDGWSPLIAILPTYLPGLPVADQWWKKVAQPPFATNATTLFSR